MRASGWFLVLIGLAAALFLAYETVSIPFSRSAGLAQADFELFFFSIVLGVPAIMVSVLGTLLIRRQAVRQSGGGYRFPVTSTVITGLTTLSVIAAFVFSLVMRSYGFFWR